MGKRIPDRLRAAVLKRDGGLCVLQLRGCLGEATEADHRCNRGQGGAKSLNGMSNMIAACGLCNGAKEDSTGELRAFLEERGVIVEPGRTHAHSAEKAREKPVWYPSGQVYRLDDAGGREEVTE